MVLCARRLGPEVSRRSVGTLLGAHHGSQVGYLLGHVSVGEWLEGRPLLCALVISAQEGNPGKGFYDLARELGEPSAH
jgi:hypothetical protein